MMMSNTANKVIGLVIFGLATLVISPFVGLTHFHPDQVFSWSLFHAWLSGSTSVVMSADAHIFWNLRVPRVLFAFLAGSGLALCGLMYQTLFRNALATPYTLGVASGASLGAAIAVATGSTWVLGSMGGQTIAAFLGALLAIVIIYGIARLKSGFSVSTLLLAGVALNFFFSSVMLFIQYIADFSDSIRIMHWLMGGVDIVGYGPIKLLLPTTLFTTVIVLLLTRALNLLSLGEDIAASRGLALNKLKLGLFLLTSLQVGVIVSLCGPIGFVGMMAPHICRLLVGQDHRWLSPASFIFGGSFLVICDSLARTLIAPAEIPVGILTALLGGPFFIWLLFSRRQQL
jgi:iron complex transport system permease protein